MEVITTSEREQLEKRLRDLVANRPAVVQRIAEARALGDLKENGDYHAAREQQGLEEAEIKRLQDRLASATVINESMAKAVDGLVVLGVTCRIRDMDSNREDLVRLVGEASQSPPEDYDEVTLDSPMGEALHKARVGETIRYNAPRGVKRFLIVEII